MKNYYLLMKLKEGDLSTINGIKKADFNSVGEGCTTQISRTVDENTMVICTNTMQPLDREFAVSLRFKK